METKIGLNPEQAGTQGNHSCHDDILLCSSSFLLISDAALAWGWM